MHSDNTAAVVEGNVHPCFLYESLWCLLGFVLLHFFTRKFRRYDGQTFLLYIVWYGACRFFIEGLSLIHIFGVPVVVAINRFGTDTDAELAVVDRCCQELGVSYALSEVFAKGGEGGVELAQTICRVMDENEGKTHFAPIYPIEATMEEKLTAIAQKIYGAKDVVFTNAALKSLKDIKALGGDSKMCIRDRTWYGS